MVREGFPEATLFALDDNIGFAAGVNRLAEHAAGEFLLLLNPDTVVHPHALENLVAFARERPQHGLYGGRTLNPDGSVHPASCWGKPTVWSLVCFATMLSTAFKGSRLLDPESLGRWQRDSVREVDIVTGCLLLAPASLWRELGGFDLRFFMYGEDADLALRAAALGYRPAITPEAVITHEIGASTESRPDKMVLVYRGKAALIRKHWPPPKRQLGLALLWAGVGLRALMARASSRREGGATWRAVWGARRNWLKGYPEPPHIASEG
jgi:GT2 family glycosyltransferase